MLGVGAALAVVALLPGTARAALPVCPDDQETVGTFTPDYARQGIGVALRLEVDDPSTISNVVISFALGTKVMNVTPVTLTGPTTRVILAAPPHGQALTVTFAWDQDAGTQAGCAGSDVYQLPLIPAKATAGDPTKPRLTGRFAVVERPLNYRGTTATPHWRFLPSCDYFACRTTVSSSSLGLKVVVNPDRRGVYRGASHPITGGVCKVTRTRVNPSTGQVIGRPTVVVHNAFRASVLLALKAVRTQDGLGSRIAGTVTVTADPTPHALHFGCNASVRHVESANGI